jgi:hypothetical protein
MMGMTSLYSRDVEIRTLRKENPVKWKYSVLGKMYGLTSERVRQICNEDSPHATAEKRADFLVTYRKYLEGLSTLLIQDEIHRLSKSNRLRKNVMEKGILIVFLKEQGLSYLKIGSLLDKHHTSIMHLYREFKKYYS